MAQTIYVSRGADEATGLITIRELNGKDISTCGIQLSLGTADGPSVWVTPDFDSPQLDKSTRCVAMLVGPTAAAGRYTLWVKIVDSPETIIRPWPDLIIVA